MYKSYKKLKVWEKAHELVKDIYAIDFHFESFEKYGLESQLKSAVVSVAANIVEGASRQYNKEFRRFLFIAKGSLGEVNYYLLLCYELKYLSKEDFFRLDDKCDHIGRMLSSLISKINKDLQEIKTNQRVDE